MGISILEKGSPDYPARLLKLKKGAPEVLYVKGRFEPGLVAVAMVGARRSTPYGERAARELALDLSRAGLGICSGLARGVDSAAHKAALDAKGTTWAVLGCGLGEVYPPENEGLARRIVENGGCLISEYPLDEPPLPHHFPDRNRIIAALSEGVVVTEGTMKSGSLITARAALRMEIPVYAVPGPFDSPLSAAPHYLLREKGAAWAVRAEDILPDMPVYAQRTLHLLPQPAKPALSDEERNVLQCLGPDGLTIEEASSATGLDFPRLSSIMFELEIRRLIFRLPGQRYAQKGR